MKIPDLNRTSLLIAFISALLVTIVTSAVFALTGIPSVHFFQTLLILFIITMVTAYFVSRYMISRFFYLQMRKLYTTIATQTPGLNIIPKKIEDTRLRDELIKLVYDQGSGDKEEIVHLKELETFRKEFLGNVSHELKTPIFTIQGYVHTLLDGGIEDNDINLLYLQKASKSIDRLISIVDDLESISKLEAGELILENRTFDIDDLINDVIESLELKAKESSISLIAGASPVNRNYVYADKDRIRQVLVNLLVNSIKYGKKGGTTKVNVEDHSQYITVDVSDNGIGIEKSHLGRLFERFYRVDKSRSREQGGTGLGLAIVKHIIEGHGQKITVDSNAGEGTNFTFTLKKSQ